MLKEIILNILTIRLLDRRKGDFSLIQLVNENLVDDIMPVVFSCFIKEVAPNDVF